MLHRVGKFITRFTPAQQYNYARCLLARGRHPVHVPYQPPTLSLSISRACNLACEMCFLHRPDRFPDYPWQQQPAAMMTPAFLRQVLARYPRAIRAELIGGGEPLLNPDWAELAALAAERRMLVTVHSNGMLLDEAAVRTAMAARVTTLGISVNAADAAGYERNTDNSPDKYDRMLEQVRMAVRLKREGRSDMRLAASFVIGRHNWREVPAMLALARDTGFERILLFNYLPIIASGNQASDRSLNVNDHEAIAFLRRTRAETGRGYPPVLWPTLLDATAKQARRVCAGWWEQLRLDGDGRLGSCSINNLKFPEANWNDMDDPFNHPRLQEMRARYRTPSADWPEPCRCCPATGGTPL